MKFLVYYIDVKYCVQDLETANYLFYQGGTSICNDPCFNINNQKIDLETKECLNSCSESENNKFEYYNACYDKCPKGTVVDEFQCLNNECEGKPDSAFCKEGTPIGYYLDDEIYKKCYEKCNYCYDEGSEINNNCIECKSGYRLISNPLDVINCYVICSYYYYFDNSNNYHCTTSNECPPEYKKLIEEKGQCVYEEVIDTTQEKEETTTAPEVTKETTNGITTETNQETEKKSISSEISKISTELETKAISSTPISSTAIDSTTARSTAVSSSARYSSTTNSKIIDTMAANIISSKESDTIYETRNSIIFSTENVISSNNIELNTYLVENTFKLERYGCVSDSLKFTCSMMETTNNTEIYNLLLNNILSMYKGDNQKSFVFEGQDDIIFQVTSAEKELELLMNSNLSENYNLSIIDFTECEKILKEKYNIAEKDSLIFIKQEKITDKESEKNIQYECFEPYNKTKLNLSFCSEVSINIYVPLTLSEETKKMAEKMKELGYNMFDINDRFYQDICSPYKSQYGSDILLSDRIDYIYNNEDAQCQGNCKFTNYALGSRYISCNCPVNQESNSEVIVKKIDKFEPKSIWELFFNVLKYSNYKVFLCYKLVFVKRVLTKNLGSIIMLILFTLYLICLITYIIKGILPLKQKMGDFIVDKDKIINLYFPPKKKKSSMKPRGKDSKKELTQFQTDNIENKKKDNKKKKSKFNQSKTNKSNKQSSKEYKFVIFNENTDNKRTKSNRYLHKEGFKSLSSKTILKDSKNKIKERKSKKNLMEIDNQEKPGKILDDFELNELSYLEAVEKDKRNIFRIYYSYIKREHRVIFSFFYCSDYNLIPIKLSRFIFLFATDMALNVFFFSDASMHKIYVDYGKIPQIIYSTIVSQLIEVFLCFLSLTDKHIYQIKNLEGKEKNLKNIKKIFKCIKTKLVFYFVFTFIFFGIYWYMVAAFCAVYENTQEAFIKDTLMSFLMSLIYPFILYLFPTIFRLIAIRCKKVNLEWMYKLSEIIPFF